MKKDIKKINSKHKRGEKARIMYKKVNKQTNKQNEQTNKQINK